MGRKLVLTGTKLTNIQAPRLAERDTLEVDGSMVLMDLNHPVAPLGDVTLANGLAVPNVLGARAAAVFGGTAGEWNGKISTASFSPMPQYKRTTKGGLYANGRYVGLRLPIPAMTRIIDRPSNSFYFSIWGFQDGTGGIAHIMRVVGDGSGSVFVMNASGVSGVGVKETAGFPITTGSPHRAAVQVTGHTQTGNTGAGFSSANSDATLTYGNLGDQPKRIYRYYVEDLTVSGRTFAQVNKLDQELYTAEVLTPGGRYYGDSVPA